MMCVLVLIIFLNIKHDLNHSDNQVYMEGDLIDRVPPLLLEMTHNRNKKLHLTAICNHHYSLETFNLMGNTFSHNKSKHFILIIPLLSFHFFLSFSPKNKL